jgi:PAS domain S-box-containing protein
VKNDGRRPGVNANQVPAQRADAHQIAAERERMAGLHRRITDSPVSQREQLAMIEMFQSAIEELEVAEGELIQQNEELAVAREVAETERHRYQELFESAPDGYLVTDAHGMIREANSAAALLLNTGHEFLVGKLLVSFLPVEDQRIFRSDLNRLGAVGQPDEPAPQQWELRLRPRKGASFDAALTVAAVRDPKGKLATLRWLLRNITEHNKVEAQRRARLETALEHERDMVQRLAKGVLGKPPQIPSFQVASIYQPASKTDRVGGDFFDFIPIDDHRLGVVIGDVCGKGLTAALFTAMVKYTLRAYALEEPAPEEVLYRVNQALYKEVNEDWRFVCLVYGVLDLVTGTFTYANAGHPPPVLYDPVSRSCWPLEVTGAIAGAFPDRTYQQRTVLLERSAVLAMFTDGVTEAAGSRRPLGQEGVCAALQEHADESADTIARAMFDRAADQVGGDLGDDVAIVIICRT